MVDTSRKRRTRREAVASCRVLLSPETLARLSELPKGDALAVARLAGIQAAKRTADWIPLAHPLALDEVAVDFALDADALRIEARAVTVGRTGVEMEALVACAASALAVYDMVKALERGAIVSDLRLEAKSGGRSGSWRRRGE